jgi:predicted amidophosphoribosyltransferase
MFCPQCGAENADNATLCKRCRKPLAIEGMARTSGQPRFSCQELHPPTQPG